MRSSSVLNVVAFAWGSYHDLSYVYWMGWSKRLSFTSSNRTTFNFTCLEGLETEYSQQCLFRRKRQEYSDSHKLVDNKTDPNLRVSHSTKIKH